MTDKPTTKTPTPLEQSIAKRRAISYLLRVEEARRWISKILSLSARNNPTDPEQDSSTSSSQEDISAVSNIDKMEIQDILAKEVPKKKSKVRIFEEQLQKGENLADLVLALSNGNLDLHYHVFRSPNKVFMHIENINFFKEGAWELGVTRNLEFDSADCYNGLYIPDVVYFIHALGIYASGAFGFPSIQKLGAHSVKFSEEDISAKMTETKEIPEFDNLYEKMSEDVKKANALNLVANAVSFAMQESLNRKNSTFLEGMKPCSTCGHNLNCSTCDCEGNEISESNKLDYEKTGSIYLNKKMEQKDPSKDSSIDPSTLQCYNCAGCLNALSEKLNKPCSTCLHKQNCTKCTHGCDCRPGNCECSTSKKYNNNGMNLTEEQKQAIKEGTLSIQDIEQIEYNTCQECQKDALKKCERCPHSTNCTRCVCNCTCEGDCRCDNKIDHFSTADCKCPGCLDMQIKENSIDIRGSVQSFLVNTAFMELIYVQNISLFSLKQFLPIFLRNPELVNIDSIIETQYTKIFHLIKANYLKETYISDTQIAITLLMANLSSTMNTLPTLPNIDEVVNIAPVDSREYRAMQSLFYLFQTEPIVLGLVLNSKLIDKKKEGPLTEKIALKVIDTFVRETVLPIYNFTKTNREEHLIIKLIEFFILLSETENYSVSGVSRKNFPSLFVGEVNYPLLTVISVSRNFLLACSEFENIKRKFKSVIELLKSFNTQEFNSQLVNSDLMELKQRNKQLLQEVCLLFMDVLNRDIRKVMPAPLIYFFSRSMSLREVNIVEVFVNNYVIPVLSHGFVSDSKKKDQLEVFKLFVKHFKKEFETETIFLIESSTSKSGIQDGSKHSQPCVSLPLSEANNLLNELKASVLLYKQVYDFYSQKTDFLEDLRSNTFKETFLSVYPHLHRISKFNSLTVPANVRLNENNEIVFYLNNPIIITRDTVRLNALRKKLNVLVHLPGRSIEHILLNNAHNKSKTVMLNYEIIHALFFCTDFIAVFEHPDYNSTLTFSENYQKLIKNNTGDEGMRVYDCPPLKVFKKEILKELRELSASERISKSNEFNDFLPIIAGDLLNLKLSGHSRLRELEITKATNKMLKQKQSNISAEEETLRKYYKNFCASMMKTENIKNDWPNKVTAFGTYRFTASKLMRKGILLKISDFDAKQGVKMDKSVTVFVSCDTPNVFLLEVSVFDVICGQVQIGLDVLLLNRYRGVASVPITEIDGDGRVMGEVDNSRFIELLNDLYIMK